MEDYFCVYPYLGDRLPNTHGRFSMLVEFPFRDGRDLLRLQLGNALAEPSDRIQYILDLDYMAFAAIPGLEEAPAWLESAHTNIEGIFEGSITDALRGMFDAEAEEDD
jgi:uncharacterized protein (TIGR04255 family)